MWYMVVHHDIFMEREPTSQYITTTTDFIFCYCILSHNLSEKNIQLRMHCQHLIHCTSENIPTCLCVSLCSDAFATPQPNISLALPIIIHHGPSFHGSEFCCWHSTAWTKCIFVWAVHSTHVQSLSTSAFQPPVLRPWHQWEDQGDGPWVWCWVSSTPHNWSFSACPKTFTIAEGSKANAVEEKIIEIGSYVIQQYWTYIIYIYII